MLLLRFIFVYLEIFPCVSYQLPPKMLQFENWLAKVHQSPRLSAMEKETDSEAFITVSNPRGNGEAGLITKRSMKRANDMELLSQIEDDGFTELNSRGWLRRVMTKFSKFRSSRRGRRIGRLLPAPLKKEPGTLILVRHGESLWNQNKTFTGWADPGLSDRGIREVEHAARLLLEGGYSIDVAYTSRLQRAIRSAWILLKEMDIVYLPVYKSWRLNERMYGALTGLSKIDIAKKFGAETVQQWRGGYHIRPPPLDPSHEHWPGRDRKHFDLTPEQLPLTESLADCMARTRDLWERRICSDLANGQCVLIVAHGNSLRGLVKLIERISDADIEQVAIPTGIPLIYKFDRNLEPIAVEGCAAEMGLSGVFLEERGLLRKALEQEAEWAARVPGYEETMGLSSSGERHAQLSLTPYLRSLSKLEAERQLENFTRSVQNWPQLHTVGSGASIYDTTIEDARNRSVNDTLKNNAAALVEVVDTVLDVDAIRMAAGKAGVAAAADINEDMPVESGSISNMFYGNIPLTMDARGEEAIARSRESSMPPSMGDAFGGAEVLSTRQNAYTINPGSLTALRSKNPTPYLTKLPQKQSVIIRAGVISGAMISKSKGKDNVQTAQMEMSQDTQLVIIRHGKTEYNKLGLFTGWDDAPLAQEGCEEAINAGKLLKMHGFTFDVVYTSWLSRAIETAWLVLDELDCLWLPIVKSWRLNERMYGSLTGLSKKMVKERHGWLAFGFDSFPLCLAFLPFWFLAHNPFLRNLSYRWI